MKTVQTIRDFGKRTVILKIRSCSCKKRIWYVFVICYRRLLYRFDTEVQKLCGTRRRIYNVRCEKKVCVWRTKRWRTRKSVCVSKNNCVNESACVVRVGGPKRRGEKVNGQ